MTLSVCGLQRVLEKKYSVELKSSGVADVSVRQDGKIMASGGWDGRSGPSNVLTCVYFTAHS